MRISKLDATLIVCEECRDTLPKQECKNCPVANMRKTLENQGVELRSYVVEFSFNTKALQNGPYKACTWAVDEATAIQDSVINLMDADDVVNDDGTYNDGIVIVHSVTCPHSESGECTLSPEAMCAGTQKEQEECAYR